MKKLITEKNIGRQSLHNLYDECNAHIRSIDFYKQELKYLQKHLADVVKQNTDKEILAQAEQFQNQFIITKNNLDELSHNIKAQLKVTEKFIKAKPTHLEEKTIPAQVVFSKKIHDVEKYFAALKLNFNKYLAKYL